MAGPDSHTVTRLLEAARAGDREAAEELYPLIYGELRRLAARAFRGQPPGHTLQPTALVHEAFVRLVDRDAPFTSRAHFFGVAAKAMRSILVDHVRARRAAKRGGGEDRLPLDAVAAAYEERALDLVALDEALARLAALDPRKARIVELRFFAGLSIAETAQALGVSPATVEREWAFARAWLHRELTGGDPEEKP